MAAGTGTGIGIGTGTGHEGGRRLDAIDALRGLAILLVFVYHAGPLAFRLAPYRPDGWLDLAEVRGQLSPLGWLGVVPFHFGFVGVHCFFVLSGFCIHLRAARARAASLPAREPLRRFFLRRFWRIYPPYWIALALAGLVAPLAARALGHSAESGLLGPPAAASDLALHAAMLHGFSPRAVFSINPAFWSLATEEQFYLAYPLAALALARFGVRRVLAFALAISLAWRAAVVLLIPPTPWIADGLAQQFLTYRVLLGGVFVPRWFEWLLGAALAEAVAESRLAKPRRFAALGALALALAMAARANVTVDKLASDSLFGLGFAALTAAALAARPAGSSLARRLRGIASGLLGALGRRAYGLYLVHQPLLDLHHLSLLVRAPLAAAAGFAFSALFERPFERRARRVR